MSSNLSGLDFVSLLPFTSLMRILALDRGTKKIGLARRSSETKITFPLGYMLNTSDIIANLAHLIQKYEIETLVYGAPKNVLVTKQLTELKQQLLEIFPALMCYPCDEAYTSVQADILLEQTNHPGQDSVAAMYILDTYLATQPQAKN